MSFPCGPWLAADDAEAAIHNWCLDSKTGGGGWGISKRSSRPSNTVRGAQIIYACHFYSPNKTCCPWRVSVEDTVDGWTIFGTKLEHNHALTQSIAESNAYASMRAIPDELKDLAKMVARVAPPKVVHRTLVAQWESLSKQVTWNYQDVYNFIGASAAAKAFDATGFANLLAERFKQQGLPYYIDTDESGSLTRAFFALEGGVEAYAQCLSVGEDGIEVNEAAVQYDTTVRVCHAAASSIRPACRPVLGPTWGQPADACVPHPSHPLPFVFPCPLQHKTNKYNLKLGIFSLVGASGATRVPAVSLTIDETDESFTWVFRRFLDCFRVAPAVMLTDGDQWMLRALQAVMPDTRRLACIWHLYKNVWTHCRGLYGEGKKAQWARFIRLWWRLAQETDATARDTWDADWAELTAAVTADVADSPTRVAALTWLAVLAARREAWAARWTWQYFTSGCDATQRTEAVNNAVKGYHPCCSPTWWPRLTTTTATWTGAPTRAASTWRAAPRCRRRRRCWTASDTSPRRTFLTLCARNTRTCWPTSP